MIENKCFGVILLQIGNWQIGKLGRISIKGFIINVLNNLQLCNYYEILKLLQQNEVKEQNLDHINVIITSSINFCKHPIIDSSFSNNIFDF